MPTVDEVIEKVPEFVKDDKKKKKKQKEVKIPYLDTNRSFPTTSLA